MELVKVYWGTLGVKSCTVATSLKICTAKSDSSIPGHLSASHGIYVPVVSGPSRLSGAAGKKLPNGVSIKHTKDPPHL